MLFIQWYKLLIHNKSKKVVKIQQKQSSNLCFTLNDNQINTTEYSYLGNKINATENFNHAQNTFTEK